MSFSISIYTIIFALYSHPHSLSLCLALTT
nr:MAG TPA: hypothetical protein [Caudoviricetes sp.]